MKCCNHAILSHDGRTRYCYVVERRDRNAAWHIGPYAVFLTPSEARDIRLEGFNVNPHTIQAVAK